MSVVGELETLAQQRVVRFFQDELGYTYLGDWINRPDNSNVEKEILANWLKRQGHNDKLTDKVLHQLEKAVAISTDRTELDEQIEETFLGVSVSLTSG